MRPAFFTRPCWKPQVLRQVSSTLRLQENKTKQNTKAEELEHRANKNASSRESGRQTSEVHGTVAVWPRKFSNDPNHFCWHRYHQRERGCAAQPVPRSATALPVLCLSSFLDLFQIPDMLEDDGRTALFCEDPETFVWVCRWGSHTEVPPAWWLKTEAIYSRSFGRALKMEGKRVAKALGRDGAWPGDGHSESERNTGDQCQAFFHCWCHPSLWHS